MAKIGFELEYATGTVVVNIEDLRGFIPHTVRTAWKTTVPTEKKLASSSYEYEWTTRPDTAWEYPSRPAYVPRTYMIQLESSDGQKLTKKLPTK